MKKPIETRFATRQYTVRGVKIVVGFYLTGRTMDDPRSRVTMVAGEGWEWKPVESEGGFVLQEINVFAGEYYPDLCLVEAENGTIKSVRILTPTGVYTPVHPQVRVNLANAASRKLKMPVETYDDEFLVAYYGDTGSSTVFGSIVHQKVTCGGSGGGRVLH